MNVFLLLVICGTQQRSSHWDDERRAVCIHSTQCVCEQRRVSLYRTRVWYGALWLCKWGEYMGTMWPKYWRRILMSLIAGSRYLTSPHAVRLRISLQHRLWTICSRGSRRLTEPPQVQTHIMCHLSTVVTVRHKQRDWLSSSLWARSDFKAVWGEKFKTKRAIWKWQFASVSSPKIQKAQLFLFDALITLTQTQLDSS